MKYLGIICFLFSQSVGASLCEWTFLKDLFNFKGEKKVTHRLIHAVAKGTNEEILSAINGLSDVNIKDPSGNTLLHHAALNTPNFIPIMILLSAGADPNAKNELGDIPLHFVTRRIADPRSVKALLDADADPNAINKNGISPLHNAIRSNSPLKVIQLLLDAGADPNAKDKDGNTPAHYYGFWSNSKIIIFGALIKAGADPHIKNNMGLTTPTTRREIEKMISIFTQRLKSIKKPSLNEQLILKNKFKTRICF